jgi:hypothetical protein
MTRIDRGIYIDYNIDAAAEAEAEAAMHINTERDCLDAIREAEAEAPGRISRPFAWTKAKNAGRC